MTVTTLANNSLSQAFAYDLLPIVAIVGGLLFAGFIVASGMIYSVSITKARENTKREIAAYVAEGSIHPDDAVRILMAGLASEDSDKEMLEQVLSYATCAKASSKESTARSVDGQQAAHA